MPYEPICRDGKAHNWARTQRRGVRCSKCGVEKPKAK